MVAPPAICDNDLASPLNPTTETFKLAIPRPFHPSSFLEVPRVWTGLWQLSSPAWGTAPAARIRREMRKHVDKGFLAFGEYPVLFSPPSVPQSDRRRSLTLHRIILSFFHLLPCFPIRSMDAAA
jgi:hypothetical protein